MTLLKGVMLPHPPIILPEVGRGEEEKIRKSIDAYDEACREIAALKPDTIVISSPHSIMYSDYFHISPGPGARGDFSDFRAPSVSFEEEYDEELVDLICAKSVACGLRAGTLGERDPALDHGTMIPLYFIEKYYTDFKIIRVGLSGLPLADHYRLGKIIRESCDQLGRRFVFVASGDLSHKMKEEGPYGFDPNCSVYDEKIMDVMGRGAFGELLDFDPVLLDKAAECGHRSFTIMAGAFDKTAVKAEALSHQATFGVGYGVAVFTPEGEDDSRDFLKEHIVKELGEAALAREKEDPYTSLARKAVECYVKTGDKLVISRDEAAALPDEMLRKQAGVFVSLHEDGEVRGCIGTFLPTKENIALEIISNGVSACSRDPRFERVEPDELDKLIYSVDVLSEPEPIDSALDLDPKKYGVIVTKGSRKGLLLPDLEGVDTAEEQVGIACRKAGISPNEGGISLERFTVVRHS